MEQDLEALTNRRKRLRYRCTHCGMKEIDLILGGFVEAHLSDLSEGELGELEALVEVPNDLLYLWFSGREAVPSEHATGVFERIAGHRRATGAP